jgi:prepilin-type N-terminal cleavage/methylation domain-containing protein
MKRTQSGFTLIEIAIVLVIIGLLLGGVLKGQELITQAKIKNAINDFNSVSVAVLGYQDRYKKYPGDDDAAAARWGAAITSSGTGDGAFAGLIKPALATNATALFWAHLRLAGFINGDTTAVENIKNPINTMGGIVGVQKTVPGIVGPAICSSDLPGKIAAAIDSQFDNGNPSTGSVVGFLGAGTTVPAASSVATGYLEDSNSTYLVCRAI